LSVELHQKLRALSVEWKSLKIKEDVLSTKFDTLSQITTGEVGLEEGFISLFSNTSKCLVKPHTTTANPSGPGAFVDSLPSEEILKVKCRFNSVDKSISVTHSDSDNLHMNSIEGQLRTVPVAVESQFTDKSLKSSSNHMHQAINGYSGATHIQGTGTYQKCEIRDVSTCATYQNVCMLKFPKML
jgi:hypothetical protein